MDSLKSPVDLQKLAEFARKFNSPAEGVTTSEIFDICQKHSTSSIMAVLDPAVLLKQVYCLSQIYEALTK
jgi:hypothetical protein